MTTYYITGIAGFVGKNILHLLEKEKDVFIVGFVLPSEKNLPFLKKDNITLIEGNILSKEDVLSFLSTPSKGERVVIHSAGRITTFKNHDDLTMKVNYIGTKNIVDAMNEIDNFVKLVYVSSVDALPKNKGKEEIKEVPYYEIDKVDGVYSKSKVLASNYVLDYSKTPASIVLPGALLGPDDPRRAPINDALSKYLHHKLPAITKGGYNLTDVRDVSKGILNAVKYGKDKESYLLTGTDISVADLFVLVGKINNQKPIKLKIPHFIIYLISPFIELTARMRHKTPLFTGFAISCLSQNSNYSYQKAYDEFGYLPTSLEDTIKDTIKWMKEKNY